MSQYLTGDRTGIAVSNENEQHPEPNGDLFKSSSAGEQNSIQKICEIDKDPRVEPALADDSVGTADKTDNPTDNERNLECSNEDSCSQIKCVVEDILAVLDADSKTEESHGRKETEEEGNCIIRNSSLQSKTPKKYLICTSLSPYLLFYAAHRCHMIDIK